MKDSIKEKNILEVKNLKYNYLDGMKENMVLKGVDAIFESGNVYTIIGESGSGKTTLISLISALDTYLEGDILFNNKSIKEIGNADFRLNYVNIVFQSYNLINYMTARENVEVALDFAKVNNTKDGAYELLETVGLDKGKADRSVLKLSGGEQQRVAIARCMAGNVPIVVADEPTGNLDDETEIKILELFKDLAHKQNKIVIIVSHSKEVTELSDEIYQMKNGIILKK